MYRPILRLMVQVPIPTQIFEHSSHKAQLVQVAVALVTNIPCFKRAYRQWFCGAG
jgi:hypothetical protein